MAWLASKRTKIVATVGPASRDPDVLREMIRYGVNMVRLNFSHGTHEEHAKVIDTVREISRELGKIVAVLQDLPGPKVRTGSLNGRASVALEPGAKFTLTTEPVAGDAQRVSVSYPGLARDVEIGKRIYLADGAIALRIQHTTETDVVTKVEVGGQLRSTQGINYPDGSLSISAVTDRDLEHLAFALDKGVDWIAVSFVRTPDDVNRVKDFIAERGKNVPVLAKIEKHEALARIGEILAVADGIMVARGDLGIEIPLELVPMAQKDMIKRANRASKPVITATQMLESMINSPRPTRAEANDVANAILDGTDAVMLSGESAIGQYPVETVRTMATIARAVEVDYPHRELRARRIREVPRDVATTIAEAATHATQELDLHLIVTGTSTGNTARHLSSFRPRARVIALTPFIDVARRMAVVWGVESVVVQPYRYIETLIEIAEQRIIADGYARSGDTIAITSGMPVGEGGTNVLKIHKLP